MKGEGLQKSLERIARWERPSGTSGGASPWVTESLRLAAEQCLVLYPALPPLVASLLETVSKLPTDNPDGPA